MSESRCLPRVILCATLLLSTLFGQPVKRPLNHHDFDSWRTITAQHLSPNGKFLAYGLFPQEGDGAVVIRNLVTGAEQREPAGVRPPPSPPAAPDEGPPPEARSVTIGFSADSRTLVFSTFPPKAESEKARKDKKPAPKDGMVIVDLASGKVTRIDRVKRFAMPEKAAGFLAYWKDSPDAAVTPGGPSASAAGDQQGGGRGGRGVPSSGPRPEFGSDLVLRNLTDNSERVFADVVEYSLTDDSKQLIYAVSAHDAAKNGVFVAKVGVPDAPAALLDGKGKYAKLTWDENQTQLLFLSDRDDAASKPAKFKLYRWDRQAATATELASAASAGFRQEFAITDRGTLGFSKDGSRVFFAVATPAPERKESTDTTADDKAVVELWSSKDDYIQPIQKIRSERDRNRTFTAAYLIAEKKVVQLGDATLGDVTPSDNAQWILGSDDREYRPLADYDERYSDAYLIDGVSGARKLLAKKHRGTVSWSPDGKYLLAFDGKDWSSISIPEGKTVNLTGGLAAKFWNEDHDSPSTPASYGTAGWTKDGKWILLYDKYDIWRIGPDGAGARSITAGYGRQHELRFRYIRTEAENPRERWIDGSKPLMFQVENLKTWESGFFRGSLEEGSEPKQLIMAAKTFTVPVKAKEADVYLLSGMNFNEFPDLLTTNGTFKELRKVSNANPQRAQLLWGTSEVVSYKNSDGVPLTAALYKPENFDPKKKYPLMVYIYEKLTQNVNRFVNPAPSHNINISFFVSNGYLVLTPDIVYTIGYPGQSALKCVLPAVQTIVDQGIVDEKAIGIQGHSWGGYQIAYMLTQTNRFRAAAAGAPVVDMVAAYNGIRWGSGLPRQFQYERTQSRIGGSIWQYPTRFIENSPIFWMDRVQTPVMILQNDADDAVPWYQGIEFFLALRRLGKDAWLFNYNGQPHGLRNRPDQKDYSIRLQQYFDHYLKGAPAPVWMEKGVPYIERERTALSELGGPQ